MATLPMNELNTLIDSMCTMLQIVKDETMPGFVTEVLTIFCNEGDRILGELKMLLEKPVVDFDMVDIRVDQLKECTGCVGALKVKDACVDLRAFCKQKDRNWCLKTLETAKTEFYDVRDKFQTMLKQLEGETKQVQPK